MVLTYKKGKSIGAMNKGIPDFSVEIDTVEYIMEWEGVFKKLNDCFDKILHKKVAISL